LGAAVLLAACKGATEVCNDPLSCNGVTAVTVTSPTVDTVMAVGRTAQLVAAAVSGSTSVSVPFTWASNPTAVATVSTNGGLVTGVSAGTVLVTASQNNNAVTGQLRMHVVDADLPAVAAAATDTLAGALRAALSNTPRSAVTAGLLTCAGHNTSGNLLALDTCLGGLQNVSAGGSAADSTLLSVLDVYFMFSQAQLGL